MDKEISKLKIDKRLLSVVVSLDQTDNNNYWFTKKPIERMGHIELLGRINYGDGLPPDFKAFLSLLKTKGHLEKF